MILSLAWRNIWRNKKRSLIVLVAVAFGLWGGLMAGALMMGLGESIVDTAIDRDLAHIQIHHKDFPVEGGFSFFIPGGPEVLERLGGIRGLRAASGRTLVEAMASSPSSSYGVKIVGIEPAEAAAATTIPKKIVEGSYFAGAERNPIVIGRELARRLNLGLRSKLVLNLPGTDGTILSASFRVTGIFKTESAFFDETDVFVTREDLFRILGTAPVIHEIAVRVESVRSIPEVLAEIRRANPDLLVRPWTDIAPEIAFLSEMMVQFTYLFSAIILFALLFGITNTMLMSIVDRVREIGVLIAVGMKKGRIFLMIIAETIFLAGAGGLAGMLLSGLTIRLTARSGLDLSAFSSSVESFGAGSMLIPFLPPVTYAVLTVMVVAAANIAAILPAWKAVRIRPGEAIRTF